MMNLQKRSQSSGFAIVITLIMVVLAAVLMVALATNATSDRSSASAVSKRLRAEMAAESGLAAALNSLVSIDDSDPANPIHIPDGFQYVTAVGDNGTPILAPLQYDQNTGKVSLDAANQRKLYSVAPAASSPAPATITLSGLANPKVTRQVEFVPVTTNINGVNQEVERYAFYIDEGGSRQNLSIQGGIDRAYARDPNELPLVTATAAPVPFSAPQLTTLKDFRPVVFTPMTANVVLGNAALPVSPPIDDYFFATASAIANLTPEGKPRVNLSKLKIYVDGLAVDQVSGNLRAKLVDRLLDPNEQGNDWGGGNLAVFAKLSHYSTIQAKQIIANLLDYLDADVFPTTDNVDAPTYFGVEGKLDTTGKVVGHPYINFVGTGLIFNRSGASGNTGGLNSTRIVLVLGLTNPWTAQTKDWDVFYIEPEVEIHVTGTASGGTLGTAASDYFIEKFSSANSDPSGNPQKGFPTKNIPANTGYVFPIKMSGTTNYATFKDLKGTRPNGLGQPPGMVFSGLGFQIKKLRLKYTSTAGPTGYVQVLDNLSTVAQPASPPTVDVGTTNTPSALTYKFTGTAPQATDKLDFHLNGDPRLNFLAPTSALPTWILSKSTESTTTPTDPPIPSTSVNIFAGSDNNNWDFTGAQPTSTNHQWYTKTDITADFYVKSPEANGSSPTFDSAGELGYIHTGIPWETLRFYVTGNEANDKDRDVELLSYVYSGTFNAADYGEVPTHSGQAAPPAPIPLAGGPLNLNTNKRPSLQSIFLGATALLDADAKARATGGSADPDAASIADALATNADATPLPIPGAMLSLTAVKNITNTQTADFNREMLIRRTANVIGTQSTRFTVYSLGEARDKIGNNISTTSSVTLRAEVELQTDSSGKPVPKIITSAYYNPN